MSCYTVTYHDSRTHDLIIICNMVYLIIVCTFIVTEVCGENNLITQAILLLTGVTLNLAATVLVFYHYNTEKTTLGLGSAYSIVIGATSGCNAIIMGVDFVHALRKIVN